jgi:hypothetical protein
MFYRCEEVSAHAEKSEMFRFLLRFVRNRISQTSGKYTAAMDKEREDIAETSRAINKYMFAQTSRPAEKPSES